LATLWYECISLLSVYSGKRKALQLPFCPLPE
jgi:hypothetical protein